MLSLEVSRSRSTLLLGQPFFFNSVFDGTFDFIAYGSFLWQLLVLLVWLFVFIFTCTFVVGFRCVCVCVARLFDLVLLFVFLFCSPHVCVWPHTVRPRRFLPDGHHVDHRRRLQTRRRRSQGEYRPRLLTRATTTARALRFPFPLFAFKKNRRV